MTILVTILHVLVCFFLVLVVLTQQGKGQDLASAFGGAGSQAAFGARGTATLLTKITTVAAVIFMVTSLSLGYLSPGTSEMTVLEDVSAPVEMTEPEAAPDPDSEEPEEETEPAEEPS